MRQEQQQRQRRRRRRAEAAEEAAEPARGRAGGQAKRRRREQREQRDSRELREQHEQRGPEARRQQGGTRANVPPPPPPPQRRNDKNNDNDQDDDKEEDLLRGDERGGGSARASTDAEAADADHGDADTDSVPPHDVDSPSGEAWGLARGDPETKRDAKEDQQQAAPPASVAVIAATSQGTGKVDEEHDDDEEEEEHGKGGRGGEEKDDTVEVHVASRDRDTSALPGGVQVDNVDQEAAVTKPTLHTTASSSSSNDTNQPRQLSQLSPPSPTPATITSCSTTAILNRTMKAHRPVVSAAKNKSRPIESAANIMNARAISMAVAFMQRHDLSIENFAREVNVAGPALEMWLFNGIDDPASTVTRTVKQYMLEESEFEYHLATQENCENLRATLSRPLHVKHDAFAASIQTLHYIWFGSSEDYIKDGSILSTPGTGKGWNLHKFRTRSFHPGENKLERMFYLETKRCCATFLDRRNKSLGEEAYSKALSRGRNGLKRILNALRGRLREDADPLRPVCLLLATTLSFVEYCDLLVGHHSSIIAETWDHIMSTWREVFYCITTDRFVPTFSPVTFTVKTSEPPLWNCLQDVIETLDNALGAMEARQGRYKWTFATFKDITDPVRRWLTVIIS